MRRDDKVELCYDFDKKKISFEAHGVAPDGSNLSHRGAVVTTHPLSHVRAVLQQEYIVVIVQSVRMAYEREEVFTLYDLKTNECLGIGQLGDL